MRATLLLRARSRGCRQGAKGFSRAPKCSSGSVIMGVVSPGSTLCQRCLPASPTPPTTMTQQPVSTLTPYLGCPARVCPAGFRRYTF